MSIAKFCLLILCSVPLCWAYTYTIGLHSDHLNECFNPFTKKAMKPNETIYLNEECERQTCGSDFNIWGIGCKAVKEDKKCKMYQDKTKKYPDCCPYLSCETR